jgi:hypothetical protein
VRLGGLVPAAIQLIAAVGCTQSPASPRGAFSISLPPGSYRLVGHSPRFGGGSCFPYSSDPADAVSVIAGTTVDTDVFCAMK